MLTVFVYTLSIFLSAILLFSIQPMFAKMVLPMLGGAPQVWNTCMVFFQAALLGGYAYAHYSISIFGLKRQLYIHLVLILTVFVFLPFNLPENMNPPTDVFPAPWLLSVLTLSIGVPFFLLSSTGPLLQRWFAELNHHSSKDPYYLYAASNLGSVMALLLYPLLVETQLELSSQRQMWAWGYLVLALLLFACIGIVRNKKNIDENKSVSKVPIVKARALRWIALAFIPSSMMLGLTSFITADIAAAPLLWVIPLTLYLLSFTITFSRRPIIPHSLAIKTTPALILILALCLASESIDPVFLFLPIHLLVFFAVAMVCHGELAKDRPPVDALTLFYLLLSVGGVLGGIFNALLSPVIFDSVLEYPLILVLAALFCPVRDIEKQGIKINKTIKDYAQDMFFAVLPAASLIVLSLIMIDNESGSVTNSISTETLIVFGVSLVIIYVMMNHPFRFSMALALWMLVGYQVYENNKGDKIYQDRSYFGVHRVIHSAQNNANYLYHGSTTHGMQSSDSTLKRVPGMYFHSTSPAGQFLTAFSDRLQDIAIIGLGTGALAAFTESGQKITYLEIDPLVHAIAENSNLFSYLSDARERGVTVDTILGDARLTLGDQKDHSYDLIILDAFSSGAIPAHLLTEEAVGIYLQKIVPKGYLLFHISNHYLNLQPIVAKVAAQHGLISLLQNNFIETELELDQHKSVSQWMLLASPDADFTGLQLGERRWMQVTPFEDQPLWTDEYSSIVRTLF